MNPDYPLPMNIPQSFVIVFLAIVGSCVGSFLNVVIYRLPRGLSIVHPPSACPECSSKIRWFDNIPVISYLILRGRCRYCKTPISPRYALVEIATAVAFVALYDAFYVMRMHSWFGHFPLDLPIFIAHLVLVAILIVCSAIDIEYYLIDIRITYVAFITGLICWSITPVAKLAQITKSSVSAAVLAGLVGAIIGFIVRNILLSKKASSEQHEGEEQESFTSTKSQQKTNLSAIIFLLLYLAGAIVIVVSLVSANHSIESYKMRMWGYVVWLFLAIIAGSVPRRESDKEIVEVIEQEKSSARAVALTEFIYLTPIIVGFIVLWSVAKFIPTIANIFDYLLRLRFGIFAPVTGFAFSAVGILIVAGFGWAVRIIFTLVFGKEAMGPGDIYILAAIGAIAGPAVAILGFFIGSVIGVFGICVLLLWKTARALSYGPWISIGAFVCLLGYNPIMNYLKPAVKALMVICTHSYK